jgi:hypothetical protein
MDVKLLRKMIKEEVESLLNERVTVDSHPKFRTLVEAKLGRSFVDTNDGWSVTYQAWNDALTESFGCEVDAETLVYYVRHAAEQLID